jgi:hypothetical protein
VAGLRTIARAIQEQVAVFFESDGTTVIQPEPARYFCGFRPIVNANSGRT